MNRYEYCDNPVEDILEDLHDGFVHDGSWARKLCTRPLILLVSVVVACCTAVVFGYGSAWLVVICIQQIPMASSSSLPLILALPLDLFALGTPIGAAIVSFSITRQYTYVTLRRRSGDSCDDRVIIPVRILSESCV